MFGPVARVSAAVATRVHHIEVEDTAAAVIQFASGALGTIEAATSLYPGYPRRLEVTGSEGTVVLEDDKIVRLDLRKPGAQGSAAPAVSTPPPEKWRRRSFQTPAHISACSRISSGRSVRTPCRPPTAGRPGEAWSWSR
jgi:predicted dehydrogenase